MATQVIFESMAFVVGDQLDAYTDWYCTEEEALAGHQHIVAMVRALAEVMPPIDET